MQPQLCEVSGTSFPNQTAYLITASGKGQIRLEHTGGLMPSSTATVDKLSHTKSGRYIVFDYITTKIQNIQSTYAYHILWSNYKKQTRKKIVCMLLYFISSLILYMQMAYTEIGITNTEFWVWISNYIWRIMGLRILVITSVFDLGIYSISTKKLPSNL